jgi:hypothetical protein
LDSYSSRSPCSARLSVDTNSLSDMLVIVEVVVQMNKLGG